MPLNQTASQRRTKPNPVLKLLGTGLLVAGFVALFMPSLVQQLLPEQPARILVDNAIVLIGIGIGLQIVATVLRVRKAASGQLHMAQQPAGIESDQTNEMDDDIDWTPLKGGGANFKTHHLVQVSPGRLEVRPSIQMILFCVLFMALGGGVGGVFLVNGFQEGDPMGALMPALIGLAFVLVGGLLLKSGSKRRVFDLSLGGYWRGSGKLNTPQALANQKEWTWLQDIKALQLLRERVTSSSNGRSSSYWSYELNLVLSDGRRLNVMDHGHQDRLRQDAETLGQFLGVPVLERS